MEHKFTSNDYLIALQLQNDLIDLEDDRNDEFSELTASTSSAADVVDLTIDVTNVKKRKLSDINATSKPVKQSYQNLKVTESIVDPSLDMLDPNPDIHNLFLSFNRNYFWGFLDSVLVQWSKKMTVCAGLCRFNNGFCSISLSEPLLKLRPRKDLVETLLHEMIHAYLFLTKDKDHSDRDGHGPEFCKHMYRINKIAGTEISIYHSFHNEVNVYQQHWWKCNGPCQNNKPFYGYVKRSINRAPGPNDKWWANHKAVCNGNFIKVKEPEGYGLKKKLATPQVPKNKVKSVNKITNFIKVLDSPSKKVSEDNNKIIPKPIENKQVLQADVDETVPCPICNDPVLTDWLNYHLQNCDQLKEMFGGDKSEDKCKCPACNESINRNLMNKHLDKCDILENIFSTNFANIPDETNYINCPNCDKEVKESSINAHLDVCLSVESSEPKAVINQIKCPCCENVFNTHEELDIHLNVIVID